MATPYIKNDGVNYKIQAGLPSAGVATLQFTDSASSPVITVPDLSGTMALMTISTGVNALTTTDMAAAFRALDGLVMPNVKGYLTNTPPASPADGDCYIIGAAPTGAWAGKAGYVTRYSTVASAWEFYAPKNGWMLQANSARESYRYTSGAWEIFYQEGTWVATLSFGGLSTGITYSSNSGFFTRLGRLVNIFVDVILTSKGTATGAARIDGAPFLPTTYGAASIPYQESMAAAIVIKAYLDPFGIWLVNGGLISSSGITDAAFTNTTRLLVGSTYSF